MVGLKTLFYHSYKQDAPGGGRGWNWKVKTMRKTRDLESAGFKVHRFADEDVLSV